jgi:hypothetical protein
MNHQSLSAFIWSVADLLRGDYKQSEYGRVILPFTVLRRLDCVLAPTKQAVLEAAEKGLPDPILIRVGHNLFQPQPARSGQAGWRSGQHRHQPAQLHSGLLARGARHLRAVRVRRPD